MRVIHPAFIRSVAAALIGATAVLGCADGTSPPAASPSLVPSGESLAGIASPSLATGSGHTVAGGEPRTFAFSAVGRANGGASGNYEIVIHAIDAYIKVDVTCMRVRNDTAWVAGIIRDTNHPVVRAGTVSYFWASDGGEGSGAVDKVSTARVNDRAGEDQRFCTLMPDEAFSGLPGNVVVNGNVQVH